MGEKKQVRKLSLKKETVRVLSADELQRVFGAGYTGSGCTPSVCCADCTAYYNTCCGTDSGGAGHGPYDPTP